MLPLQFDKIGILSSYAYMRKNAEFASILTVLSELGLINFLVDSGAFTAYHAGSEISLPDYMEFCKRVHDKCYQYIMLDVIANPVRTRQNLDTMLQAGLKPMPVFTIGEEFSVVKELVEYNECICVAGGAATKGPVMQARIQKAYKASKGKAKIHGLAFVKYPLVAQLPMITCDSSTYTAGNRFGMACIFDKVNGMRQVPYKEGLRKGELLSSRYMSGLTPAQINNDDTFKGTLAPQVFQSYQSYIEMEQRFSYYKRKYFFAMTNIIQLSCLIVTLECQKKFGRYDHTYGCKLYKEISALSKKPKEYINRIKGAFQ